MPAGDPRDAEKRLLRGHVAVTMLAMYAEFNLRRQRYPGLEDDAALIVQSIENAELGLASGSGLMVSAVVGADAQPETLLASYNRVSRVVDVLQVALDVERPTRMRGLDNLRHLAVAVGGTVDGQRVSYPAIDGIQPGKAAYFTIEAEAVSSGDGKLRAELRAMPLGAPIRIEEPTRILPRATFGPVPQPKR